MQLKIGNGWKGAMGVKKLEGKVQLEKGNEMERRNKRKEMGKKGAIREGKCE